MEEIMVHVRKNGLYKEQEKLNLKWSLKSLSMRIVFISYHISI